MNLLPGLRLAAAVVGTSALACVAIASGGPVPRGARLEPRPAVGCVIAATPRARGAAPVTVRFVVREDGTPERFEVLTPGVGAKAAATLWAGIRACKWEPALGTGGKPLASWLALPVAAAE